MHETENVFSGAAGAQLSQDAQINKPERSED
jgi:hypothetical protein